MSDPCPSCGRADFVNNRGMHSHSWSKHRIDLSARKGVNA